MSAPGSSSVDDVVAAGGPHLAALLVRVEDRLGALATDHGGALADHARSTIAAGGKRLRPLLVLLAGGDPLGEAGGDPLGGAGGLVRAATAVELVHSASLVHDDVLDGADLRRGHPTVVAAAGRGVATATGDLLFARAFAELVRNGRADEIRVLSDATSALARGELLQRADAWNAAIAVERYLERCELKTARLFEAACRLGALEGGAGDVAAEHLGVFGRRIGLAFQLLDDVLDVSGPEERTGKHRGTDLLDGTVTLPYLLARTRDAELAALDPRTVTDPGAAAEVCDRIAATGALDDARARALAMVAEAKRKLPADLLAAQRRAMDLVADGVVARYA
jgi:geranylgeranyl pyrophosphate synthase